MPPTMQWHKKGLVYAPSGDLWWARSHAHLPTVDPTVDDVLRVYFTGLDENNYGRIGYVDLDPTDPARVLAVSPEPVLDLGELGAFDDCGTVISSITPFKGSKSMYYHGFQRTVRAPYLLFTGLAVEGPDERFKKHSRVPVLDRIAGDPFIRAAPWVIGDGDLLKMWYVSCVGWSERHGGLHYQCNIRYAASRDGIDWQSHDQVCIEPDGEDEYAVGRPCVLHEQGLYKMWYSRRGFGEPYAMGYAESTDGLSWERKDALVGIYKSETGWDSEMVCYPCVADVAGRRLMFYNGNRRGASGFGYAVLES
ncbi:MAG: hypothetical protein QOF89_5699 [Acidobacteriota bacterium]|jgi:hypothetical protein|nr:hypothetical protein [Acidobacteriota bacterium]